MLFEKIFFLNVELQFAQKVPFKIKGTPVSFSLGGLAELGEELLYLDLYVCPKCGEVRFFADEKSMQSLLRLTPKQFLKKCVLLWKRYSNSL